LYVRNGHNPKPGVTPSHWFKGSGMLHGVRLVNGRAEWLSQPLGKNPCLDGAPLVRDDGSVDLTASVAGNISSSTAADCWRCRSPTCRTRSLSELDTFGPFDFHGKLTPR